MKFQVFDLHQCKRGQAVVVTMRGNAANVRLLDSSGLSAFKRGARHTIHGGGHVTRSPYRMVIPRDGHWYVTVDFGGYAGRTNVSVSVEPAPSQRLLPPARSAQPPDLGRIRQSLADAQPAMAIDEMAEVEAADGPVCDVFISHASEDKDDIVRPLAEALQAEGLVVWYDEFTLRLGDSLRRKIDHGLATSRFGVVVLSKAFFAKNWTQYELDGFVTREQAGGEQLILPIWHNLSKDELIAQSPPLADKVAVRTSDYTIAEIAAQIAEAVRPAAA
jgi:hypothetical protein